MFFFIGRWTDAAAVLHDEQTKKPCRRFLQRGNCALGSNLHLQKKKPKLYSFLDLVFFSVGICDFGPNCRFSHMSEQEMFNLQRHVQGKLHPRPSLYDSSEAQWPLGRTDTRGTTSSREPSLTVTPVKCLQQMQQYIISCPKRLILYGVFSTNTPFLGERQSIEESQERQLRGRSIEDWLSRREKRRSALSSEG